MALPAKKQIKAIRIKGLSSWLLSILETSTWNPGPESEPDPPALDGEGLQ